jgi:hypothetical protein
MSRPAWRTASYGGYHRFTAGCTDRQPRPCLLGLDHPASVRKTSKEANTMKRILVLLATVGIAASTTAAQAEVVSTEAVSYAYSGALAGRTASVTAAANSNRSPYRVALPGPHDYASAVLLQQGYGPAGKPARIAS